MASFFADIGGFDRAFELEKAAVVFQCEKDKFCRSVLKRHWPQTDIDEDIRSLTAGDIPDADVWTAGFPCQDVSLAREITEGRDLGAIRPASSTRWRSWWGSVDPRSCCWKTWSAC